MISAWYKHLDNDEDIERFKHTVRSSGAVLERQLQILDEMEDDVTRQELNPMIYDKSNWEFRQADNNGYRRCLKQLRRLISLADDDFQPRPKDIQI